VGDITTVVVVFWALHPVMADINIGKISRKENRFSIYILLLFCYKRNISYVRNRRK
jgi:hypothetical protein